MSYPTALARTSSTMLNRNDESKHFALFTILSKGIQSFIIRLLAIGFYMYVLYQVEKIPFCSSFAEIIK